MKNQESLLSVQRNLQSGSYLLNEITSELKKITLKGG